MNVLRVDKQLVWNIMVDKECVGWIRVSGSKLIFTSSTNAFAPKLTQDQRVEALNIARKELTQEEMLGIDCGGFLEFKDYIAEFLSELGINSSEAEEQAIQLIKGMNKRIF